MARHLLAKLIDTTRCFFNGDFDKAKGHYDDAYAQRMDIFACSDNYEYELKMMAQSLSLKEDTRLLDFGCNTGQAMHKIHGWIGCEVWGIDQNMAGIEAARTQFPQYRFDWYEGDALPYADTLFDAVMLNHVIGHVRNPHQSIHEIARILRPGGRVGIVTPNRNYKFCMLSSNLFNNYQPDPTVLRYYTVKSLNKLLTTAGFRIIESRYIGEFPRGFAFTHLKAIRFRVFTIGEKEE